MALGTFSNGGIGFGVAFTLQDYFTATADKIENKMGNLSSATDKIANKINDSFGKIASGAAMIGSGVAIVAPLMAAVNLSSDYAENMNKLDVAFGKYASDVKTFTDGTLQNFGIDKIMSSDMASLFGDMATGMGFAQQDAAGLSMKLVGLAGDLASFKNISHDVAKNALKSVFTTETEALGGLGIVANQQNLQNFAKTQGITTPFAKMSQTEKVMLKFNFVLAASKNAVGDFVRTGDGFANVQRKMIGTFKELAVEIGDKVKPALTWLFAGVMSLTQMFVNFSKTGLGKFIINISLLGAVFSALTLIIIGVVMVFEALAGIMMTMLPLVKKVSIAFGAIAIVFGIVNKAFEEFAWFMEMSSKGMAKESANIGGLTGFLIRLGAILSFVGEVFSTMTGEGFQLSEGLEKALKDLGIFEFAIAIATWIGRIRGFFMGLWAGLEGGLEIIYAIGNAFFNVFGWIFDALGLLNVGFGKNTDEIGNWVRVGVYAGYAIIGALTGVLAYYTYFLATWAAGALWVKAQWIWSGITMAASWVGWLSMLLVKFVFFMGVMLLKVGILLVSWIAAGISMVIAWLPVILVIAAIIAVIWAAIWVFNHFGEIVTWVGQLIWGTLTWVYDGFIWLFGFIFSLPSMMFNWGVDFVLNLWEGIKSMWGSLVAWLESMITGIWDTVTAPFKWLGDKIGGATDWITGADSGAEAGNISSAAVNEAAGLSNTMASNFGQQYAGGSSTNTTTNNNTTTQPAVVNLQLDSDLIYSKMIEKQEMDNARKP